MRVLSINRQTTSLVHDFRQLGSAHTHRAWPLATIPQTERQGASFTTGPVNIAKLSELVLK
jgi:hypothetical protein